ncbi:M24 family metallopeptidase [Acidaminobacter hydrogenoformans]|uniref:Xaa-Pro dipeptidase n=1 Tax=Acidaminobacter hydrogenoformans DSM 2784 TaxID=1120920 RepID=A0A1G5S1V0_9FIRM|nr:Xaa-Pro peptidase family protein [Acidaminobacter hydrogenoformans]SCZ80372.1 Xaa-Pro dipeptidase [Acidaminobacter hydrogenoformans DSM 2784]
MMFTKEEYQNRFQRIKDELKNYEHDAVIISNEDNIYWLSGFFGFATFRPLFLVVHKDIDEPFFITPKLEYEAALESTWISDISFYIEWKEKGAFLDIISLLKSKIEEKKLSFSKIFVETATMPAYLYNSLKQNFKGIEMDNDLILRKIRMIKSPEEIMIMRKVAQVVIAEVEAATKIARIGVEEWQISMAAQNAGYEKAAELLQNYPLMTPLFAGVQMLQSGSRSHIVHGRATTKKIQENDVIMMCFCEYAQFAGYRMGFTRQLIAGIPTPEFTDVFNIAKQSHDAALTQIKPGVTGAELDIIARKVIVEAGYGEYITHRTGRGVGASYVEGPEVKEGDAIALQPGMIITVEPGIYVPGVGGARIEDTVLITENGYEILTKFPDELKRI